MHDILSFLRRRWTVLAMAALLGSGLSAGCTSLDEQQRKWIFQAQAMPQPVGEVMRERADGLADVWIEHRPASSAKPVRLHGLWAEGPGPDAPLLLYLHGARRNVEASSFRIRQMQELGFAVLAIDYRGFGLSTDELPSEPAVVEDAKAAWDFLGNQHPGRARYIFGHSLGGAIAVQLAAQTTDEQGVIVEGSFTSVPDVFRSFKWGWLPITPFITQRFDSVGTIAKVGSPVLVVHGSRDGLITPDLGRALFDKAAEPKRFILVEGGTHYSTNRVGQLQYREALRELFGLGAAGRNGVTLAQ
jgi:alpha-beta hydrolase superfamily lysophospholipase